MMLEYHKVYQKSINLTQISVKFGSCFIGGYYDPPYVSSVQCPKNQIFRIAMRVYGVFLFKRIKQPHYNQLFTSFRGYKYA
jgi:hypothetical protein